MRNFVGYPCAYTYGGLQQHYCYSFDLQFPPYDPQSGSFDTCPGTVVSNGAATGNDWQQNILLWQPINFEGELNTTAGQTPTYYYPQRIGDVDDVGITVVQCIRQNGSTQEVDLTLDICLLKRGRGIKCFEFG